ncbi:TIGR04540 family protein [Intestinibacter bartlettii]|uniref:Glycosyl transferase n=2 Tax=Bacillota TaxID=1239 RepID=A0A6N2ZXX6_9FIRM|nr:TIGR04540 family protein [Intestinibacter bartlettii]MCB5744960.1 TIGR04540 family protein [Intestinibacter bartlettii]MDU1252918.1 TIGR04540 family protein [Peptostreptococcaceae bacterium]MDU2695050.1 TIGR04540 family protein [Intestinibacter bartlettii]MDU6198134.1 TIGR04540 family protein [Intestinibacter bartlettii]
MEVKRFYKNQTEISAAINKVIDSYLNDKIDEESMVKNIKIIYENNYSKIIKNGDYAKVLKQRCGKRRLEIVSKVIS